MRKNQEQGRANIRNISSKNLLPKIRKKKHKMMSKFEIKKTVRGRLEL
jgi:hypothetical protein